MNFKFKNILRIAVAIIFIFSGFVKAVDPIGFSFKLDEYFSPTVFNLPFLQDYTIAMAVFISCLEFLLGVALLLKIRIRRTLNVLLLMCIFFGFLTFYSAYFNVVTDCGCFGDAVKLTPWSSFVKDIILLILILVLQYQFKHSRARSLQFRKSNFITLAAFFLSCILLSVFVIGGLIGEPLIDFRDYKIGTDLKAEKAKIQANPSVYKVVYTLKNMKTGEEKTMPQDEYIASNIWKNKDWEILADKTKDVLVKEGYDSTIKQFRIIDAQGVDITEQILNTPKIFMIFTYKPDKLSPEDIKELEEGLIQERKKGYKIFAVSTKPNTFSRVPHGTMDGTAIKTIARSNPFILILKDGVIIFKHEARDYFHK